MSDWISREDALEILEDEGWVGDSLRRIHALPAVQQDAAAIRIATLREAEKALRKWQDNLILCGYREAPITVGMAADLIATLKGETT